MNKILMFTLFIVLLFISVASVRAQTDCDPNLDPNCETNPDVVPLDGGVGLLLGAAIFYGIRKLKAS